MDQCIQNTREKDKEIWEQELCLDEVINETSSLDRKDPRGVLFRRMMNEDPRYREYFENLLSEVLNHRLPMEFLKSRIGYYEKIGNSLDTPAFEGEDIRPFFKNRPKYLRKLMQKYFHSSESYFCQIKFPENVRFEVYGYDYVSGYEGWYFKGSKICIQFIDTTDKRLSYWLVNENKVNEKDGFLNFTINSNITIQPVINGL